MVILLTVFHVIISLFLCVVVLLQSGKAADLAGAFGGMGSQTVFGPRGSATVLSKATTVAAALFMITSMILSIIATRGSSGTPSLLDKAAKPAAAQQQKAPATKPGQTAPITVTPNVGGQQGQPQTVNVPVVPAGQTPQQQQQAPQQPKK